MICIGIDGGGTNTRAVVVRFLNSTPQVLGRGTAPSSNHYSVGLDAAIRHIEQAAAEALCSAQLSRAQVERWGLGLAGACTRAEQEVLSSRVAPLTLAPLTLAPFASPAQLLIDEDVAATHAGAFADSYLNSDNNNFGAVCIAGTGANSFGINSAGKRARSDGWGPLLGDRGSGYRIGEAALRTVCAIHDKALVENSDQEISNGSPLLQRVLDHFVVESIAQLLPIVYHSNFTKDKIAALVPDVVACADKGDRISLTILNNAGRDLAFSCASVMRTLDVERVAPYGSILQNIEAVHTSFEKTLRAKFPNLQLTEPKYEADIGAALLAFTQNQIAN